MYTPMHPPTPNTILTWVLLGFTLNPPRRYLGGSKPSQNPISPSRRLTHCETLAKRLSVQSLLSYISCHRILCSSRELGVSKGGYDNAKINKEMSTVNQLGYDMETIADSAVRGLEDGKDNRDIAMSRWHHGNARRLGASVEILQEAQERTRRELSGLKPRHGNAVARKSPRRQQQQNGDRGASVATG